MNINNYTPLQLSKKPSGYSTILHSHLEPMMLSMLVLTGIVGSIYLFGHPIGNQTENSGPNLSNGSYVAASLFSDDDLGSTNKFDDYVKMDGKLVANETFYFDFIQDEKASRYVMEMGDGVRLIVTQKNLQYEYALPGKYTIELKEINKGILQLVGTKKIKVK